MTRDEIIAELNRFVACELVEDIPTALRIDGFLRLTDIPAVVVLLAQLQPCDTCGRPESEHSFYFTPGGHLHEFREPPR